MPQKWTSKKKRKSTKRSRRARYSLDLNLRALSKRGRQDEEDVSVEEDDVPEREDEVSPCSDKGLVQKRKQEAGPSQLDSASVRHWRSFCTSYWNSSAWLKRMMTSWVPSTPCTGEILENLLDERGKERRGRFLSPPGENARRSTSAATHASCGDMDQEEPAGRSFRARLQKAAKRQENDNVCVGEKEKPARTRYKRPWLGSTADRTTTKSAFFSPRKNSCAA